MRNRIFSTLLIMLFVIGIRSVVAEQKPDSSLERRILTQNSALTETNVFDKSFQNTLEDLISDQLLFRNNFVQSYYAAKILAYRPIMSGLIKINDDVIKLSDSGYYIKDILEEIKDSVQLVSSKGYNFQEFADYFPNVKFYIYQPVRLEETALLDFYGKKSYGANYHQLFLKQLKENINYNQLQIESIEDYEKFFYKTDVHWNIDGAYQGYSDIIKMIQSDFEIDDPKPYSEKYCFPQKFYGSLSNRIGQVTEADHICDLKLENIGAYTLFVNDYKEEEYKKGLYAEGYKEEAYSDYDYYFGSNEFKRVYYFNEPTKPNLLVLTDSFTNPIRTWLSSHFNVSVFLDLRSENVPDNFVIKQIMEEYDIDAVLICMYYDNLYFNGDNFVPLVIE